ncbi:hypothetical protein ND00_05160 [Clostridium sp. L74]|nr:hypothetical protein ND00_05160 [Clostridium sp. L74]
MNNKITSINIGGMLLIFDFRSLLSKRTYHKNHPPNIIKKLYIVIY